MDINTKVEELIEKIKKDGINTTNLDHLYKLEDIHYKMAKEKHMKGEEDSMMYRTSGREYGNYDAYGRGRARDSMGRYMDGDMYGRRYRGHDYIEDMGMHYGTYMDGRESGRYGSPETSRALDYMLKSLKDFVMTLKNDASSQEEIEKIKRTAREIADNV